ncbi:MAG: hypothetical protein JW963_16450 [Anaerolineales bacterium]|nr:hypothetical protein [Anaerolineales bacterium]
MTILDQVMVIVRSAHERTEELCLHLVRRQIPAERVTVIHERPFTAALRRSYEIGIENGLAWTLCIDADVLIRKNAIIDLISEMSIQPDNTFGGVVHVFYKFRERPEQGGLHLYRTSLLSEALSLIPDASSNLRPETYVKKQMENLGHNLVVIDKTLGLHDFEQFYADIFRKSLVRARKSPHHNKSVLQRAIALSRIDQDFLVAAWGIRVGMNLPVHINLDAKQWESETKVLLLANGMQEKEELEIEKGLATVEKTFLDSSLQTRDHAMRIENQPKVIANRFYSVAWQIGWGITQFGLRIQRSSTRRIHAHLRGETSADTH